MKIRTAAWPPFVRRQSWAVQYEFLGFFIVFGNSFQASDERSMSEFSLNKKQIIFNILNQKKMSKDNF